jgi:hypothetical protein
MCRASQVSRTSLVYLKYQCSALFRSWALACAGWILGSQAGGAGITGPGEEHPKAALDCSVRQGLRRGVSRAARSRLGVPLRPVAASSRPVDAGGRSDNIEVIGTTNFLISRHFRSSRREFFVFGGISFLAPSPAPASDRSRRSAHRALPSLSPWPPRGAASISR